MSVETWKREFYTEHSKEVLQSMSWEKCCKESLLKWEGIKAENLEKHGVSYCEMRRVIEDNSGGIFPFNGKTCPLCLKLRATPGFETFQCYGCPVSMYKASQKIMMENKERCACAEEYKRDDNGVSMRKMLEKIIVWLNLKVVK